MDIVSLALANNLKAYRAEASDVIFKINDIQVDYFEPINEKYSIINYKYLHLRKENKLIELKLDDLKSDYKNRIYFTRFGQLYMIESYQENVEISMPMTKYDYFYNRYSIDSKTGEFTLINSNSGFEERHDYDYSTKYEFLSIGEALKIPNDRDNRIIFFVNAKNAGSDGTNHGIYTLNYNDLKLKYHGSPFSSTYTHTHLVANSLPHFSYALLYRKRDTARLGELYKLDTNTLEVSLIDSNVLSTNSSPNFRSRKEYVFKFEYHTNHSDVVIQSTGTAVYEYNYIKGTSKKLCAHPGSIANGVYATFLFDYYNDIMHLGHRGYPDKSPKGSIDFKQKVDIQGLDTLKAYIASQ